MAVKQNSKIEKLYFSIGEVAEMLNVKPSLIRYWEKEFSIIHPNKNKKGNRSFTQKDIKNLKVIYNLVKVRGMTLKGAKKKIAENKEDTFKNYEIVESLTNLKEMLLKIKDKL